MAPSVTAVPSVNAAAPAPHFVSVLMCTGPNNGKVFAVLQQDLVHRRKKLDIGAHVLVKQHDGSKRVKGVVVHMNPLLNARVPPPAQPSAVSVVNQPRQRPSKRPREPEQPSQADNVALHAAKRFKPDLSRPGTTLPGVPSFQPAMLQMGLFGELLIPGFNQGVHAEPEVPRGRFFTAEPCPPTRYPGRHRVRRELTYGKTSMKLKGSSIPVSAEELDGVVPLDCLDDIVTLDELSAFVTQAVEEAAAPVASASPFHSTPIAYAHPAPLPDVQPITPFFSSEFRPLRPAPFSRRLVAAEAAREELQGFHTERLTAFRRDNGQLRCGFLDLLSSPRLG